MRLGTIGNSLQKAAKVLRTREIWWRRPAGSSGDVLITYPDGYTPDDIREINARVNDYADWPLSQVQIEDWESGLSHKPVG